MTRSDETANPFAALPSINLLQTQARSAGLVLDDATGRTFFQQVIDEVRAEIDGGAKPSRQTIVERALDGARRIHIPRLSPVINATGVIVHTNLGRAPVSPAAAEAMRQVASGYVPLELEVESGQRGGRMSEISGLMRLLTGAEATLAVNNNAAAVLLTLSALAAGRSVIVSRGEAVEIGGGFRIPDVLRQSGAHLVEVGTTNRTYVRDYEQAIDDSTAVLMKVHPSNFAMTGFTTSASIVELAVLGAQRGIPVVEDLGSGALLDTRRFGLGGEPTIGESLAAGAAVVTASGDKLLGGPQAGIIAGQKDEIARIERHPLARAVRADKTCLAGLAATLRHYVSGDAIDQIPVWRMISVELQRLHQRADHLAIGLRASGFEVEIVSVEATIGGGSLPGQTLPSVALAFIGTNLDADGIARKLRIGSPAIFGRVADGRLLLDLRTVLPEDDSALAAAIERALS